MIGGTTSWVGPLVGAILLGSIQQVATVTISSAVNLLIVGLLLVAFVIIAPNGIVGLVQERLRGEGALMTAPLLHVSDVGKRFGGFVALDGIDLDVAPGERLGLIGPNGSGKSRRWSTASAARCRTRPAPCTSTAKPWTVWRRTSARIVGLARSFQLPRPFHA